MNVLKIIYHKYFPYRVAEIMTLLIEVKGNACGEYALNIIWRVILMQKIPGNMLIVLRYVE